MSKLFKPCQGKTACQENEEGCKVCGRSAAEIQGTRELIESISQFTISMDYLDNDSFIQYLAAKALKKIQYQLDNAKQAQA